MTRRCPKCGYTNPGDAGRCRTCGFPLVRKCPRCGTERSWRVEQCPNCAPQAPDAGEARLFTQLFQSTPHQKLRRRYVLKAVISRSRVSSVYRVTDTHGPDNASYALKEIADTALITADERHEAAEAFTRRVEAWARLDHPGVVRLVDYFSSRGKHYAVMDLIRGWNLEHICSAQSISLREEVVRNWGAQLCDVLAYLHAQDPPIHFEDLKPGHVMVTRQGRVKLVDLGLTRLFLPWGDSAPGQVVSPPGAASDTYALGKLLQYVLTRGGTAAKAGPRDERSASRGTESYSRELRSVVARATRKRVASRSESVADLRRALWGDDSRSAQPMERWATMRARAFAEPADRLPPRKAAPAAGPSTGAPLPAPADRVLAPQVHRPELRVSPRFLDFGELSAGDSKKAVLTARNPGNKRLTGRLMSHVPWILVSRAAFQCEAGQARKLVVTLRTDRLDAQSANEPQALSIEVGSDRQWIGSRVAIKQGPALRVGDKVLDFGQVQGDGELTRQVSIFNEGDTLLRGVLKSELPWLSVPKGSFSCRPHGSVRVGFTLLIGRLPVGRLVEPRALLLDSDVGQERIEVRVHLVQPLLRVDPRDLDFGQLLKGEVGRRSLRITNSGEGVLRGIVRAEAPWLQLDPDVVHCDPGESATILVALDTVSLGPKAIRLEKAVSLESNAGQETISAQAEILAPRLSVSQQPLRLTGIPLGETSNHVLPVLNVGSAPLEADVESALEWLTVTPHHFTCAPGESVELSITADTSAFSRGLTLALDGALRIASNDGTAEIGIELEILKPLLAVTPSVLNFGVTDTPEPVTRSLLVRNEGTGTLYWEVQTESQWVEIEPTRGQSGPGKATEVRVTAYRLALPDDVDLAEGTLILTSDAGEEDIPMAIAIASPRLALDVDMVDLGTSVNYEEIGGSFTVFNRGLGDLVGTVRSVKDWLSVEPEAFECPTGRSQLIRLVGRLEGVPAGAVLAFEAIQIESNGGHADLGVAASILVKPDLEVVPLSLLLGERDRSGDLRGSLILRNTGRAVARVQLSSSSSALVLQREICLVKPGKRIRLGVRMAESALLAGENVSISVRSDDSEIQIPVEVAPA